MRKLVGFISAALLLTAFASAQTTYKLVPAKPDPTAPRLVVASLSVAPATSDKAPVIQELTGRYQVKHKRRNMFFNEQGQRPNQDIFFVGCIFADQCIKAFFR